MKFCVLIVCLCVALVPSVIEASTVRERVKRDGGVITAALIGAGATLLGGGDGGATTWELPSGQKIDVNKCWHDGSGPCPNGNCLDKGRRGIAIKETTVSCQFFCVWRSHCRTQLCCAE